MKEYEIDIFSQQTTSSFFILQNGKPIIRIESLKCEGIDTVLEQIKAAIGRRSKRNEISMGEDDRRTENKGS